MRSFIMSGNQAASQEEKGQAGRGVGDWGVSTIQMSLLRRWC